MDEAKAQTQSDSEVNTPNEEFSTQMIQPDNKVDVTSYSVTTQDEVTVEGKPNNSAVAMQEEESSTRPVRLKRMPTRFKDFVLCK